MRSDVIAVVSPKGQFAVGIIYRVEDLVIQQHADLATTKPQPLAGTRQHLAANFRTIWRLVAPDSFGIDTNKLARPASQDVIIQHSLARSSPSHIWCSQFFPGKSFGTTLSSIVSANGRL
jgi:hypothetical protein